MWFLKTMFFGVCAAFILLLIVGAIFGFVSLFFIPYVGPVLFGLFVIFFLGLMVRGND